MNQSDSHQSSTPPSTPKHARQGFGLIGGMFLLLTISIMALGFMSVALDSNRATTADATDFRVRSASETVTSLAVDSLWGEYLEQAGSQSSLPGFRSFLDQEGIMHGTGDHSILGRLEIPERVGGVQAVAGVNVEGLSVARTDDGEVTRLSITSTLSTRFRASGGRSEDMLRKTATQTYSVEGGEWQGLGYALLANNINCIMCHASIDNAQRFYNHDVDGYGNYQRVKVGSLESLELRNTTNSSIAGTLYVAGTATNTLGEPIVNWGNYTLRSRQFDANGYLDEDTWGNTMVTGVSPADEHTPLPNENLYLEYGDGEQVDGYLPEAFPEVFPDDGGAHAQGFEPVDADAGNRRVDDSEFQAVAQDSTGSLAGGTISVNDRTPINSLAEMSAFTAGNRTSLGSIVDGNVYLNGTPDDPILLNGDVAISGDLILSGTIKGEGSFRVAGNVYVPDSLVYADGVDGEAFRTYGEAQDGTRNALAIASGGNVIVGDMFHPLRGQGVTTGDESGSFSFILQELAIFNRKEWMKTQTMLPGPNDVATDPSTYTVPNPFYEGADYTPRYYALDESGTVPLLNGSGYFDVDAEHWRGPESAESWDAEALTMAYPSDTTDPLLYEADGTPKAFVSELTTTGDWIDMDVLRAYMDEVMAERAPRGTDPIEINAFIYSNNSVFGIIPLSNRNEGTDGRMRVNGAMIAADMGLLAPRRLEINYDPRGRELLGIRSGANNLSIRRLLISPSMQ